MDKNLGNLQPLNEENFFTELDALEEDSRKEKIQSILQERNDILDSNRKLFARTKEAEGFKQDDDGNWIKTIEPKAKKDSVKSDEGLMKRLDTMALKMAGITAADEVELFNKWKDQTGREADDIVDNKIFMAELADLRTAKANTAATDIKGGDGKDGGQKNDPDYWIAKATKDSNGELLFPDDLPNDYNLRASIVDRLAETSKDKKRFYNQK